MSDESSKSRWWKDLASELRKTNTTFATEHTLPLLAELSDIQRYLSAMALLHAADAFLVTQKRTGQTQNYLCGTYLRNRADWTPV